MISRISTLRYVSLPFLYMILYISKVATLIVTLPDVNIVIAFD